MESMATSVAGRVVCFGEMLVRLTPPPQEWPLQSPWLRLHFGGAESNVAVSLACLGHASALVSVVPDNFLGRAAIGELRRCGVDAGAVQFGNGRMGLYFRVPGAVPGTDEVVYDRAGSAFALAAAGLFDWPRLLAGAGWLHVSGIDLAVGDPAARHGIVAVQAARAAGVRVSFDCNFRDRVWGDRAPQAPALMREVAASADLLFGGERDVALMLGLDFERFATAARFARASEAAFSAWPRLQRLATTHRTRGGDGTEAVRGLLAVRDGPTLATPARSLARVVDRIGSGDAFAAALLHGLLTGSDDAAALEFAMAAACLKLSIPGDANPARAVDIRAYLAGAERSVLR